MLSHLGYIPNTGARDSNIKLCKKVKLDVLCAFCECGGIAPILLEPTKSQHLQGSVESEEPYARPVRAPQCMHLVVLLKTLQGLVGPFGILQVLLRSYSLL